MYEQARPSISDLFSCPFHGRDHALRDRPAGSVVWLRPRGDAVSLRRNERERNEDNALCGALHLIRHGIAVTPSPQGEGFFVRIPQRLPLEGEQNSPLPLGRYRRMEFQ